MRLALSKVEKMSLKFSSSEVTKRAETLQIYTTDGALSLTDTAISRLTSVVLLILVMRRVWPFFACCNVSWSHPCNEL